MHFIVPPVYLPKGVLVNLAEAVKKEVSIPVITQGRLYDPDLAERVLREGKADYIQLARGLLADPHWVKKIEEGRPGDIRKCISCNRCFDRILKAQTIRCAVNPTVGREGEFEETPSRAPKPRKVVIVGAGPAGLEAARVCGERGHRVTLYEQTGRLLGGQIALAAQAPGKEEFRNITDYYQGQFKRLRNVTVRLRKTPTVAEIVRSKPDVVMLATGAVPVVAPFEGTNLKHVVSIADVMGGRARVSGRVVIAGGGCAGIDCANYLSSLKLDVTVVEAAAACALDEELVTRLTLLYTLGQRSNLKLMTGHTIARFGPDGVYARDPDGAEVHFPADYIVTALGFTSHNPLEAGLRTKVRTCLVIGHARQPAKIMEAVADGFFAAMDV